MAFAAILLRGVDAWGGSASAAAPEPTSATVIGHEIDELKQLITLQQKKVTMLERLRADVVAGHTGGADGTCQLPTDYLASWEEDSAMGAGIGETSSRALTKFDDYLVSQGRFEVRAGCRPFLAPASLTLTALCCMSPSPTAPPTAAQISADIIAMSVVGVRKAGKSGAGRRRMNLILAIASDGSVYWTHTNGTRIAHFDGLQEEGSFSRTVAVATDAHTNTLTPFLVTASEDGVLVLRNFSAKLHGAVVLGRPETKKSRRRRAHATASATEASPDAAMDASPPLRINSFVERQFALVDPAAAAGARRASVLSLAVLQRRGVHYFIVGDDEGYIWAFYRNGTLIKRFETPQRLPVRALLMVSSTSVAFASGGDVRFVNPGSWRLENRVCEGSTARVRAFEVDPGNKRKLLVFTDDGRMLTFAQRKGSGSRGFGSCALDSSVVVAPKDALDSGAEFAVHPMIGYVIAGAGARVGLFNRTRFVGPRPRLEFHAPMPICEGCGGVSSKAVTRRVLAKRSSRRLSRNEQYILAVASLHGEGNRATGAKASDAATTTVNVYLSLLPPAAIAPRGAGRGDGGDNGGSDLMWMRSPLLLGGLFIAIYFFMKKNGGGAGAGGGGGAGAQAWAQMQSGARGGAGLGREMGGFGGGGGGSGLRGGRFLGAAGRQGRSSGRRGL